MAELANRKKAINYIDDQMMCRHGFHQWVVKSQTKDEGDAQPIRAILRCRCCGKERLMDRELVN